MLIIAALMAVTLFSGLAWFAGDAGEFGLYAFGLKTAEGELVQSTVYMGVLLALACAIRRRDRGVAAAALCLLMYLFTVCLGPLVGNRYSFCMMTGAPLLIGLMCTPRAHNLPETGKPVCRR